MTASEAFSSPSPGRRTQPGGAGASVSAWGGHEDYYGGGYDCRRRRRSHGRNDCHRCNYYYYYQYDNYDDTVKVIWIL